MKRKNNIRSRMLEVFFTIQLSYAGQITFNEIVARTGFSPIEVDGHIGILAKDGKIGSVYRGESEVYFPLLDEKKKPSNPNLTEYACVDAYGDERADQYLESYAG